MRRGLAAWAIAVLAASVAVEAKAGDTWITSYADAQRVAAENKKVILMDFTGSDWCGWCIKLKSEVFDKPEFAEWARKNVVLLEVDFPRNKKQSDELKKQNLELQQKFKIEGYPTIVLVDAAGKEIGRTGYLPGGPAAWLKQADGLLRKAPADGGWLTSHEEALKIAGKEKKLVLADFTGSDWCGWCIKLKSEVFDTQEFKEWADKNVVLLELDFPRKKEIPADLKMQNDQLLRKHDVQGFPTILFLDAKGKKVGQLGYEPGGPAHWIKKAQAVVDKKR